MLGSVDGRVAIVVAAGSFYADRGFLCTTTHTLIGGRRGFAWSRFPARLSGLSNESISGRLMPQMFLCSGSGRRVES